MAGITLSAASAGQVAQPEHGLNQEQEAGCGWRRGRGGPPGR